MKFLCCVFHHICHEADKYTNKIMKINASLERQSTLAKYLHWNSFFLSCSSSFFYRCGYYEHYLYIWRFLCQIRSLSINQSDAVKAPFLPRPGSSAPSGLPRSDLCRSRHQLGQELPQQLCQHPLFEQVAIVSYGRSSCTNALQWCVMKDQAGNQIFTQTLSLRAHGHRATTLQYNSGQLRT